MDFEIKEWFTIFFGIPILLMVIFLPWDSPWSIVLPSAIAIVAMIMTATVVTKMINKDRLDDVEDEIPKIKGDIKKYTDNKNEEEIEIARRKLLRYYIAKKRINKHLPKNEQKEWKNEDETRFENLKQKFSVSEEKEESPAVILGMGGLYAIIGGLGITEALTTYAEGIGGNAEAFGGTMPDLFPYSWRLLTFLVTMVPFIHGFILTFSNRWYYDIETGKTQYKWAFVFFIVVFLQTILLFFAAVNVWKFEPFIFILWILMAFNIPWLYIQIWGILKNQINIVHVFPKQWIILNLITFLFLLIFVRDQYFPAAQNDALINAQNDALINFLIFCVLLSRSIADYMVGWKDLYNRTPEAEEP